MPLAPAPTPPSAPWWDLAAASPRLTQHGAWIQACLEGLGPASLQRLVAVGPAEAPVAFAPLVRTGALGRVGLLGVDALNEPTDLLAVDASARDALCEELADRHYALEFKRLPADGETVDAVRRAYRGRGAVLVRPYLGSPIIRLDASWREAESQLNARRRSDFRRARRHAEKLGPVSIEIHAPNGQTLAPILAEALDVELRSWKGAVGAAILQDEVRGPTLRRFASLAADAGILRLALLRVGEKAVAMQFAAVHGDAFWLLKVAYDEAFARCSPGQLLTAATVSAAASEDLARYEFLGSPEAWTALWANDEQPCVVLRTYPYRPAGMTLLAADGSAALGRRVTGLLRRGRGERPA